MVRETSDAASRGGNSLRATLTLHYARKYTGEPVKYEDVEGDPCAPGAVKKALKRAQTMVENNEAISAGVDGRMRYSFGVTRAGTSVTGDAPMRPGSSTAAVAAGVEPAPPCVVTWPHEPEP